MKTPSRWARRGWAGALALGLGMGVSLVSAAPASAATLGPNFLRNWETGKCLDSGWADESDRAWAYTNDCDSGNDHHKWYIDIISQQGPNDIVMVRNVATGRCLSRNLSLSTGGCNSGDALQQWQAVGSGWDKVSLKDLTLGNCLDSNKAGSAYMLGCNGGGNQLWKLGF